MKKTAVTAASALAVTAMITSGWLALAAVVIDRAARRLHTELNAPGVPEEDQVTNAFRRIQLMCDEMEERAELNEEWINTVRASRGVEPIDFEKYER